MLFDSTRSDNSHFPLERRIRAEEKAMAMAESITVRVPQVQKLNPNLRCSHLSDRCRCAELMIQNQINFKRTAAPVRFMFYRAGFWEDFQSQVFESLRSGFMERKPVVEIVIGGAKYRFDFLRMLQVDLGSGNQRSVAWIDQNGKPFFPKLFLDEDFSDGLENSRNLKLEIEIRIDGGNKRKSEHMVVDGKDAEVTSSIKKNGQGGEVNGSKRQRFSETSKWPSAKLMSQNDRRYSFVSNLFLSKIIEIDRAATITAIREFVLSGPLEKARWEVFEKQNEITKAARGASNVVYAWYAAKAEEVASIMTHGFAFPTMTSRLPAYGVGIYLSPVGLPHLSATLSVADNNGEKHIILCRLILGNVEKVEAGSRQTRPSTVDFDTGSDDPNNPKCYVVWSTNMNRHILPMCVVSYKTSTHVPGQLGSFNCRKLSLKKLILEMKKRLPSFKLQQIVSLYGTFKAGKLHKELFIKQLRAITGDEVLMSMIQEIRSSG